MPAVCVFCASSDRIDPRYLELADAVGAAIAARGWTCVSGGGSVSMMGRLVRAVRAGGGHTIGVIPQGLKDREVADLDADELIVTHDMRQRKGIMDERSDAFLALPGGIGTLEELMEAWTSLSLTMHDKPIVVIDPWDDYALLRAQVAAWVERGFVSEVGADRVHWTTNVQDAFEVFAELLGPKLQVDTSMVE
ncbi:MAG: TIGR00730 family Rossman fold protein [Candidatus Nanopelagicales bacterium]